MYIEWFNCHNSCATTAKSYCDDAVNEKFTYETKPNHNESDGFLSEEAYLKEENKLLKGMVIDKNSRIAESRGDKEL